MDAPILYCTLMAVYIGIAICNSVLAYTPTMSQWYEKYKGFYGTKKDLQKKGVRKILYLFHGTNRGLSIDYENDHIYTVDIDPKVNPDYVHNANDLKFYDQFKDIKFDVIVVSLFC